MNYTNLRYFRTLKFTLGSCINSRLNSSNASSWLVSYTVCGAEGGVVQREVWYREGGVVQREGGRCGTEGGMV